MPDTSYTKHDTIFLEANGKIRLLTQMFPINEIEEKKTFFKDPQYVPRFKYNDIPSGLTALASRLSELECGNDELGMLYAGVRDSFLAKIAILQNRGNSEIVLHHAKSLFGEVDDVLLASALEILARPFVDGAAAERNISSVQLKEIFEQELKAMKLDDWSVELSPRFLISVIIPQKALSVTQDRFFSAKEARRLVVHEIGAHVIRAVNGAMQPYKIFSIGTPQYSATEEGVAVFSEYLTDLLDENAMRNYAGQVVGVRAAREGMSFRETYFHLKETGIEDARAWRIAVRAHRGGGLARDHIYLKGYLELKELFKNDRSDLPYLFAGKVNASDVGLVKRLIKDGELRDLDYVPSFLAG